MRWFIVVLSVVLTAATVCAATTSKAPSSKLDVLLMVYDGNTPPMEKMSGVMQDAFHKLGCERVIMYPKGYVPVVIPEEEVEHVKAILGKDRCLRMSPELK